MVVNSGMLTNILLLGTPLMYVHRNVASSPDMLQAACQEAHQHAQTPSAVYMCRSLGTESNQSPEMLVTKEEGNQKQFGKMPLVFGSGRPSDVWSLGCLLFELFTGNLLYPESDQDFARFFSTLTGMADEVRSAIYNLLATAAEQIHMYCMCVSGFQAHRTVFTMLVEKLSAEYIPA